MKEGGPTGNPNQSAAVSSFIYKENVFMEMANINVGGSHSLISTEPK